jgi:small GTP-binding protein
MELAHSRPVKVVFAGDTGVGKTCIIRAAIHHDFEEQIHSTVGPGFEKLFLAHEGRNIKFEIWDTAGQEQYRAFTTSFIRNANAVVLVFDLTGEDPLTSLSQFVSLFKQACPDGFVLLLIGNKSDLRDDRHVTVDRAMEIERLIGATSYIECSALTQDHVLEIFETIAGDDNLRFADDTPMLEAKDGPNGKDGCKC